MRPAPGSALDVLARAADWIDVAGEAFLVTVAETQGSAPRPPGALFAVAPDGRTAGAVSGGCVEDALVREVLRGGFDRGTPRLWRAGVTDEEAGRIGLPCGGRLTLVVERLGSTAALRALLERVGRGERVARRVCLETGEASLHPAQPAQPEVAFDGRNLVRVFGPAWRVLILGAGALGLRLAELAASLEFAVTVWDPRPEYIPETGEFAFLHDPPEDVMGRFGPDARSAVVGVLHAAAMEDVPLAAALRSPAFYVGALGSRRTQAARRQRLAALGVGPQALGRLDGPAGLDIGARTTAEIALSMAAGLVQARNVVRAGTSDRVAHG